MLTGENGLLAKAQLAKERNIEAENDEKDKLSSYENELSNYGTWERTGGNTSTGISRYLTQNYAIVGSPFISKGVVSGFSSSSYLILPETFNPGSNSWEMVVKFTTSSNISSCAGIAEGRGNSNSSHSCLSIYQDRGTLKAFLSSDGPNWNITQGTKIIDLTANTTYYLKLQYDGSKYTYLISSDGTNYEQKLEINSSTSIYSDSKIILGRHRTDGNTYFPGSIDLKESYIKINGQLWWDCWME